MNTDPDLLTTWRTSRAALELSDARIPADHAAMFHAAVANVRAALSFFPIDDAATHHELLAEMATCEALISERTTQEQVS